MVIDVKGVTVAYRTGDFTQIGLKEYVVRKIKRKKRYYGFVF